MKGGRRRETAGCGEGRGGGGGREEEEEELSMHDQTSASHWSASLAFSDRRLWPKTMGEGGRGGEEGKMVGGLGSHRCGQMQ